MYEIGKVYIWQNMTGDCEYLNGSECTVTGMPHPGSSETDGKTYIYQHTDVIHRVDRIVMAARAGQLRPKNPPPGEQRIRDLFANPVIVKTSETV